MRMCRMLAYLGPTIPFKKLLVEPPNSLVNQAKAPRHHPLLQLAGWGFAAWSKGFVDPLCPLIYKRACAAFFDDNLETLVPSLRGELLLAHVRAANYKSEGLIADENCHPFSFEGAPWVLAHNGFLLDWLVMQAELLSQCDNRWIVQRKGTTDTELIYTLFLTLLQKHADPYSLDSLRTTLQALLTTLIQTSRKLRHNKPMKLKLLLASSDRLLAVNYGAGFDGETELSGDLETLRSAPIDSPEFLLSTLLEPLYVQLGKDYHRCPVHFELATCQNRDVDTVLVASEPLSDDESLWGTLDFGQMLVVERGSTGQCVATQMSVFDSDGV